VTNSTFELSSLIPLRKKPQIFTVRPFAIIAPSKQLRFAPPDIPTNATGQLRLCGQSFRIASRAAPSIASRHGVESCCGLIVASDARMTQPSASAGG
jgi:hypothetical protein